MLLKQNNLLYGALTSRKYVEWTGNTKSFHGHNFNWAEGVIIDISDSNLMRFALKGTNDTWIAFAEEKDDKAKKITYVLGGWNNSGCGVHWMPKG